MWIQCTWSEPYIIDATRVMWWYDNGGVKLPLSAIVQYWNGSEFVEVTNMKDASGNPVTSVGVEGNGTLGNNRIWNGVTFDPIVTTKLRLLITEPSSPVGVGVGIGEWEIFGLGVLDDPELRSVIIVGEAKPVIGDINTYKTFVIYPNLEGVTYEWSVDNENIIRIVGDNTGETVNVEAVNVGIAKITVKMKDSNGNVLTTGTYTLTIQGENGPSFDINTSFNMDGLTPGYTLNARVDVTNNGDEDYKVIIIAALYEADKMVNVSYISKIISVGASESLSCGFKLPSDLTNHKVKVFVWDGDNLQNTNMIPLSDIVTLE
ncbi:MAG: hypothetical protein GX066_06445 [Clostridiaceae bacterium]|nr:hypothetical protein [Clostridiaceae bacterium]